MSISAAQSIQKCQPTLECISELSYLFGKEISSLAQKCLKNSNETEDFHGLICMLKNRILTFKNDKAKDKKEVLKEMKSAINQLIDMQAEKDLISYKVEEEFSAGKYEDAIKALKDSNLRFSQDPLHKAYYYGEFARLYIVMGKCKEGREFIDKEESYIKKIPEEIVERKFLFTMLYFNKIRLYQKEVWLAGNSPYTSESLKDDAQTKKALEILNQWKALFTNYSDLREKLEFCRVCGELGSFYANRRQFDEAIKEYEEGLKASEQDLPNISMELLIDIGDLYQHIPGGYRKAIEYYEKAERLASIPEVPHAIATCLMNKAFCRYRLLLEDRELKKLFNIPALADTINAKYEYLTSNSAESERRTIEEEEQAKMLIEREFREAIRIFSELEWNLHDIEHQVAYFNIHDLAYISFENFLYAENKTDEALEIAQSRRARALRAFIEKKYSLVPSCDKVLTVEEIKDLAKQFNTIFVLYSLAPCQLKIPGPNLRIWMISSTDVATTQTPIPQLLDDITTFSDTMKAILGELRKDAKRALEIVQKEMGNAEATIDELIDNPETMKQIQSHPDIQPQSFSNLEGHLAKLKEAIDQVNKQLEDWYFILIPKELHEITKEKKMSLTIIPERELAHIPFAALKSTTKAGTKYLIEDYPLSIAPSIHMLKVLDKLEKPDAPQREEKALIVYSNPNDDLLNAPEEVKKVCSFFEGSGFHVNSLTGNKASYENFFQEIEKSKHDYIHLICHGTDKQAAHQDSVFKGALKFASKFDGRKYIYGNDIAQQTLDSQLVFISSCLSGKGRIHQEGNVGLMWAFLAAGAKSIVSCLWPLYDTNFTLDMVQNFYDLVFKDKTKAEAFQETICNALESSRDRPDKWGLLFLAGLNNKIKTRRKLEISARNSDEGLSFLDFL